MIKIHRDNRVIFWLLIGGLVLNILWSLRLELQAKTIKTIVEKYHLNLNKNVDTLVQLKKFRRWADNIEIATNDQKMSIDWNSLQGHLFIHAGFNSIEMGNFFKHGGGSNQHIRLRSGDEYKDAYMSLSSRRAILGLDEYGNKPFHIEMKRNKELIEIRHHDSIFRVGKTPQGEGIAMGEKDSGSLIIRKDKGIGLTSTKKIILEARGEHGELSIVSDGDINIRSKNGVVRINGKKIHMNKPAKSTPLDKPDEPKVIPLDKPDEPKVIPLDKPNAISD